MSQQEAIEKVHEYLHLIGKPFKLPDGETETIKAVVAWKEIDDNWSPHVCFYKWNEDDVDGNISHMNVDDFFSRYHPG